MRYPQPKRRLLLLLVLPAGATAQTRSGFTRADTLRGSFTTPGRVGWDVSFYDLRVAIIGATH